MTVPENEDILNKEITKDNRQTVLITCQIIRHRFIKSTVSFLRTTQLNIQAVKYLKYLSREKNSHCKWSVEVKS